MPSVTERPASPHIHGRENLKDVLGCDPSVVVSEGNSSRCSASIRACLGEPCIQTFSDGANFLGRVDATFEPRIVGMLQGMRLGLDVKIDGAAILESPREPVAPNAHRCLDRHGEPRRLMTVVGCAAGHSCGAP